MLLQNQGIAFAYFRVILAIANKKIFDAARAQKSVGLSIGGQLDAHNN
jgi:hypothetical protein